MPAGILGRAHTAFATDWAAAALLTMTRGGKGKCSSWIRFRARLRITVSRVIWLMVAHNGIWLAAAFGGAELLVAEAPATGLADDPLPGAATLPHPASTARPSASAASRRPTVAAVAVAAVAAGRLSQDGGFMATCFPGPLACLPRARAIGGRGELLLSSTPWTAAGPCLVPRIRRLCKLCRLCRQICPGRPGAGPRPRLRLRRPAYP